MINENIPENLRLARLQLEEIKDYRLLEDWKYFPETKQWRLLFRLNKPFVQEKLGATDWYVFANSEYPVGKIKIYPSLSNGITCTYPHQEFNVSMGEQVPWRSGAPCLDEPYRAVGRQGSLEEPITSPETRLQWHVERLIDWLQDASNNQLLKTGDPYEVPSLPIYKSKYSLAVAEDSTKYENWKPHLHESGIASLCPLGKGFPSFVVHFFKIKDGHILNEWGSKISENTAYGNTSLWVLVKDVPTTCHWRLPTTWGELQATLNNQGIDLMGIIRSRMDQLRSSSISVLLIGFPIPEFVGEDSKVVHWYAVELPQLPSINAKPLNGFRTNSELGKWYRDARLFSDNVPLKWMNTDNWSEEQLARRGTLNSDLRGKKVLLIGAGALGAVVAELLAKMGVNRITIIDGDDLNAGNLVRHPLGLQELEQNKALATANKLNNATPFVQAEGIKDSFPHSFSGDVNLVVDCTGNDELLIRVQQFNWGNPKTAFISVSFGLNLGRLFCYFQRNIIDFAYSKFLDQYQKWQVKEKSDNPNFSLPKEGIGCWHPAFPGRYDDVVMWASVTIKQIEESLASSDEQRFDVFRKKTTESGLFIGIEKDQL